MSETMRAVEVDEPGGEFELVERDVPEPSATEVRVEVEACGVCHSDSYAKEGGYPGLSYPRIPGHEIVGRVDAVGEDVELWEEGDRVGAGWHAGHCFVCEACRRGEFQQCENEDIHGVTVDGGYAEYAIVNAEALAAVPDELDATDAAPLLCAGITTYNALRHTDARPGDLVAVQGIGGLGHLGVQYARQAGFETVAISRGTDKEEYARELGADHFIDAEANDPAEELQKLGGAKVVLATAPNADAISSVVPGLDTDGEVVVVGVPGEPIDVSGAALVGSRGTVRGWASGHARESQDTLEFSALRDITPEVETFDLVDADDAYERMMENDVRFRAVLEP
ncbi:alcohol dehydrogenase [Haladaptatus sp. DYF46]|uniref:alcohol dehydrogenase n=1 Tax=Haladaptatus sp. DYF46 TaxID=2886041 RepID=UPI001E3B91CA|nr:alcohol dehydrogenase [Haladaptatus sp. DYF46]